MPQQVIEIMIDDWEIECCAPPPEVGAEASWTLGFLAGPDELAHEATWTVRRHEDGTVTVERGTVRAAWSAEATPPPPGEHPLLGHLSGTVHGGGFVPETLAPVAGRVRRVRVVSREVAWDPDEERMLRDVPGTTVLRDVRQSPRWFRAGPSGPGRHDVGVLIDLAVDGP